MFASRFLIAVAAVATGWVGMVDAVPVELGKREISSDVLSKLSFYSQYAAASYCLINNNSTGTKITCPQGNCPLVEAANTTTLTEFENTLETDTTGFVAVDYTNELIVVSFRGSQSIRNWIADVEFTTVSTTICDDCDANDGFWNSWKEAEGYVMDAVTSARKTYSTYKLVFTGHSAGAAVAALGTGVVRSQGITADLYTYGQPKVGKEELAEFLTNTTYGNDYRVTHKNDPVPRLPPMLLGYRHESPEFYISSDDTTVPTTSDITEYTGIDETEGSEKDTGFDVDAHRWYFGHISSCEGVEGIEF